MGLKRRAGNLRHRSTPIPLAESIGSRIKALRDEQDFTFDGFVGLTGLGRGYVSELERGLVVPSVVALEKVAQALQVTIADLVLGDSLREQLFEVCAELTAEDVSTLLDEAIRRADARKT